MAFMSGAQAGEVGPGLSASSTITGSGMMPPPAPPDSGPLPTIAQAPTQTASVVTSPTIVSAPAASATTQEGSPAQAFDQRFKGTPLEGQWSAVEKSAAKYGVEPKLVASVMAHESGNGAKMKPNTNNPGGIMDPASDWKKIKTFDSLDKGIDETARVIAKNNNRAGGDLAKLANIYAPPDAANNTKNLNKDWLPGVRSQLAYFNR